MPMEKYRTKKEIPSLDGEVWAAIDGYSKYQVSNLGRVKSFTRKARILRLQPSSDLYLRAEVVDDKGEWHSVSVARMVAKAFVPNPNMLPQVNHINENVQDNRPENLEWCDGKYNSSYGTRGKRIGQKLAKAIEQYDRDGNLVARYMSSMDAKRHTGYDSSSIIKCCKGKLKHHHNYTWKYGSI